MRPIMDLPASLVIAGVILILCSALVIDRKTVRKLKAALALAESERREAVARGQATEQALERVTGELEYIRENRAIGCSRWLYSCDEPVWDGIQSPSDAAQQGCQQSSED